MRPLKRIIICIILNSFPRMDAHLPKKLTNHKN